MHVFIWCWEDWLQSRLGIMMQNIITAVTLSLLQHLSSSALLDYPRNSIYGKDVIIFDIDNVTILPLG